MTRLSTAKRFAQAAFELAREEDELAAWQENLWRLASLLEADELSKFLEAPLVSEADKLSAIKNLLPGAPPLIYNLVGVLLKDGVVSLLPLVAQEVQELIDREQGVERAIVSTAVPVDDDIIDAIRKRLQELTGKQVEITVEVSPSILGGFVARVGDRLIDGSTRTRLRQLKAELMAG
jgi:F-type H+-transporting ATPase subunit delta